MFLKFLTSFNSLTSFKVMFGFIQSLFKTFYMYKKNLLVPQKNIVGNWKPNFYPIYLPKDCRLSFVKPWTPMRWISAFCFRLKSFPQMWQFRWVCSFIWASNWTKYITICRNDYLFWKCVPFVQQVLPPLPIYYFGRLL